MEPHQRYWRVIILLLFFAIFSSFDAKKNPEYQKKIQAYLDLSKHYFVSDTSKCIHSLNQAMFLAKQNQDWRRYVYILRYEKLKFLSFYNRVKELKSVLIEIDALIEQHGVALKGVLFNPTADMKTQWAIYFERLGYNAKAIQLFQESEEYLFKLPPKDSAICYNQFYNSLWLASMYKKTGSYAAAIQKNLLNLSLYERYETKIKTQETVPYLSNISISLGDLYLITNDTVNAYYYYNKANDYLKKFLMADQKNSVDSLSAIHNIKYSLVKYYNYIKKYDQSLRLLQEIKTTLGEGNPFWGKCHMGIGDVFARKKILILL